MNRPVELAHPFAAPERITVVSGLPRSGTSLLMQLLESAGIQPVCDAARPADRDNPRGYYELGAVKRIRRDARFLDACRGRAVKIVAPLVLDLPPGHRYRVLFAERALAEILASQAAMLERQAAPASRPRDAAMGDAFGALLARCRAELTAAAGVDALFVRHRDLVERPDATVAQIARFLERTGRGVREPADAETARRARAAMARVVDGSLHRQRV